MEPLIYFPTFEPPSDLWLKFSLLYFENFKPIVPLNRQYLLSDNFRRIENKTDLLTLYSPGNDETYRASLRAIEEVERILRYPSDRSELFHTQNPQDISQLCYHTNILKKWRNQNNRKFLIYEEKFSNNWARFCVSNNLGEAVEGGILLPEELAFLYMTYLAKEIAFIENAAIITDNNRFDNFTNYARLTTPTVERRTKFAKGLFNFLVPQNLSEIPFEKLIKFRNKNRKLISVFNRELSNVQDKISEGCTHQDFINNYNNIYSEFSKEILTQGLGIASIPFAAYMIMQNPSATTPEYVHEVLGALGIILGGGYALNRGLKDTEAKRCCKKYLINLKRLR